ncbi:methyltransferase domain-containing protein [Luethyella okanaganae]|uniref:Methyltransferase domain-containing protein n=1 Tax=Luethyella okanaganae TaxID=69372 RepID=A0ABW1VH76_9MICO
MKALQPDYAGSFTDADAYSALDTSLWLPISLGTLMMSRPRPGERVFDACCGSGASAVPTAMLVGPRGRVDGVDLSAPLLALAHSRALELPQLHLSVGDVLDWPGRDYDLVQCVLGILFLPDLTRGAETLIAKAMPGGRIAFTIWRQGAISPVGDALVEALRPHRPEMTEYRRPLERPLIETIGDADNFEDWLRGLGLTSVSVGVHERRLELTPRTAWAWARGTAFRAMFGELEGPVLEEVRASYLAGLAARGAQDIDVTTLVGTGVRSG